MFNEFDFTLLDDPDFKEDSVREELVIPLIRKLGYSATSPNKIVRSKSLIHPYVAIGSKQRKVSIIPDYLFHCDNSPFWVLDAKSPTEDIIKSKHVEQAYSYAIHPEVRAKYYALCNGREFSLYSINKFEPIMHFYLADIAENFEILNRLLNPNIRANDEVMDYLPDYGIHMLKLGAKEGFSFTGLAVNSCFIAKVEDDLYTTTTTIPGDIKFAQSIDFNGKQLEKLLSLQPDDIANTVRESLKRQPYYVLLDDVELKFGMHALLSTEIQHNAEEQYLPFIVKEILEYREL
ncbi:hypothetical protein AB4298_04245 [Shewanella sp. 10N.261.52.F9]|uniref:hypothetical protein n=1 Tax=Shewanella sp. 10N.261.52.F9 TaxID=3229684 RepID=UPI00354E9FC3